MELMAGEDIGAQQTASIASRQRVFSRVEVPDDTTLLAELSLFLWCSGSAGDCAGLNFKAVTMCANLLTESVN